MSLTLTLLLQLITGAFVFPLLCLRGNGAAGHESSVGVDVVVVWWVWVFGAPTAHWRVWVFGASTAQWWVWVFGASTAKDPRSKIAAGHVGVVLQTSSCQVSMQFPDLSCADL